MPIASLLVFRRVPRTVGLLILAAILCGVLVLLAFGVHPFDPTAAPRPDLHELAPFRWEAPAPAAG